MTVLLLLPHIDTCIILQRQSIKLLNFYPILPFEALLFGFNTKRILTQLRQQILSMIKTI